MHWLPVEQRNKFKIASITYKSLHYQQPSYFCEFLSPVAQSGRRSSSNKLLNLQRFNTISDQRSFFSSASKIWNYLPTELCLSPSLCSFRSKLRTFHFPPGRLIIYLWLEYMHDGLVCDLNMRWWIGFMRVDIFVFKCSCGNRQN